MDLGEIGAAGTRDGGSKNRRTQKDEKEGEGRPKTDRRTGTRRDESHVELQTWRHEMLIGDLGDTEAGHGDTDQVAWDAEGCRQRT